MRRYIAIRLLHSVVTIFGVSVVVFLLLHLIPGDPVQMMLGEYIDKETYMMIYKKLGLDQPIHIQYFMFLSRVLHGDLGESYISGARVLEMMIERIPATLELGIAGMIIAIAIAVPAGIISATKQYSIFDYFSMTASLIGVSIPSFWQGIALMLLFSLTLGWLPSSGIGTPPDIKHLILPAITLGTGMAASTARLVRSSMLEVLSQDYITTARAKGLREIVVIHKHALKNALIPVVTNLGNQIGHLIGGAVVVETVFAWPGVGRLVYTSITNRDFPVIQGCILLVATSVVFVNLLVDISYAYLNPKIRYRKSR